MTLSSEWISIDTSLLLNETPLGLKMKALLLELVALRKLRICNGYIGPDAKKSSLVILFSFFRPEGQMFSSGFHPNSFG